MALISASFTVPSFILKNLSISSILVMDMIFFLIITLITIIMFVPSASSGHLPGGKFDNDTTTCEEFSRFARFNPYSVLSDEWMLFYYWGPNEGQMFVKFYVPTDKQIAYLQYILEGHVLEQINWTAKMLLMVEKDNSTYLLVEQSDRGHYHLYVPYRGLTKDDVVNAVDIRIKQTGDNRYIGIMECVGEKVYIFARVNDVPKKKKIQDEAAKLGYRGRGGRSYLYQGHEWMPIGEADDYQFEEGMLHRDKFITKHDIVYE